VSRFNAFTMSGATAAGTACAGSRFRIAALYTVHPVKANTDPAARPRGACASRPYRVRDARPFRFFDAAPLSREPLRLPIESGGRGLLK
jgi:hypothetical protein